MKKKQLFDDFSYASSKLVTIKYSTSFSIATKMLSSKIRWAIYNIYGFVRLADEIVDSFHEYDKESLILDFERQYFEAKKKGISLNPILNSFIHTVNKYKIEDCMVNTFLESMKADLYKTEYTSEDEYKKYIYGSADVVGLMCLKVFVNGDEKSFQELKEPAMRLGSAFQKINFLRDLKEDYQELNRSYFPNVNFGKLDERTKNLIIEDIESDFEFAYKNGILKLPIEAKFGVFMAFRYYKRLLKKLKAVHHTKIMETRIRISNPMKINLLARSYVKYKLNLI